MIERNGSTNFDQRTIPSIYLGNRFEHREMEDLSARYPNTCIKLSQFPEYFVYNSKSLLCTDQVKNDKKKRIENRNPKVGKKNWIF